MWPACCRGDASYTSAFVFRSERYEGKAIRDPKRWWQAVLKEAEVKDLRWHDLRHTFASRLVMAGVDMRTVQELMGHSDANMTARYAHLSPEHNTAAIERLVSPKKERLLPGGFIAHH